MTQCGWTFAFEAAVVWHCYLQAFKANNSLDERGMDNAQRGFTFCTLTLHRPFLQVPWPEGLLFFVIPATILLLERMI